MAMTVLDEGAAGSPAGAERERRSRRRSGVLRSLLRNEVVRFAAGGLLAALLVGAGTFFVVTRDAETQAIQHAKDITQVEATGIVQPALSDSLLHRDPAAIGALDVIVRQRILSRDVVRVKLWTSNGTIIYSDENRLIGRQLHARQPASRRSSHGGAIDAGVSEPHRRREPVRAQLRQAAPGVPAGAHPGRHARCSSRPTSATRRSPSTSNRCGSRSCRCCSVGLALLLVVQIPLAVGMARRLRASLAERQVLLERVINASEQERRRIARDLHDGVVQRLAAVTFSLSALARRLTSNGTNAPASNVPDVEHAAGETRAAMRDLRTLIVEIAPPNLHAEGIDNALRDLLEPLAGDGVAIRLDAPRRHRAVGGHDHAAVPRGPGGAAQRRQARRRHARRGATAQPSATTCAWRSTTTAGASAPTTWRAGAATATWVSACSATSSPTRAVRCTWNPRPARGRASPSRCPADGRRASACSSSTTTRWCGAASASSSARSPTSRWSTPSATASRR